MRALTSVTLLLAVGCTPPAAPRPLVEARDTKPPPGAPAVVPSGAAIQEEAAEGPGAAPPTSCSEVSLLGCALPPSTPRALCASLSQCIVEPPEVTFDGLELECNRPQGTPVEGTVLAYEAPATPPGSGLGGIGVINALASEDMTARLGASYLVARVTKGWCLVDNVLDWMIHRSYFQTDFETRWDAIAGGFRLLVQAHRIGHESLDQEELAAGESDVTGETCNRLVYEVLGGRLTRVSQSSTEGACGD